VNVVFTKTEEILSVAPVKSLPTRHAWQSLAYSSFSVVVSPPSRYL